MRYGIVLLAGALTLAGCTAAHKQAARPNEGPSYDIDQTGTIRIMSSPVASVKDLLSTETGIDHLIAVDAELRMSTVSPDSVLGRIAEITSECRGRVVLSATKRTEIEVPTNDFVEVVRQIGQLGEVIDRKTTTSDVAIQSRDLQMRLETATKTRERYLELLAKAVTVEEIIKVEKELERITGTIENLKRELQSMENQVQYARIAVTLSTPVVYKPGPIGYPFYQLFKGASWLFVHK